VETRLQFLYCIILSGFGGKVDLYFISFFFLLVVVLGFELRTLHLWRKHCITWATSPALPALVIFQIGSWFSDSSLKPRSSFLCLLHSWDDRHELHAQLLLIEMGSHSFCLGYSWTTIAICTSWVARITGLRPCTHPCLLVFNNAHVSGITVTCPRSSE
jgi:hypothetical protein